VMNMAQTPTTIAVSGPVDLYALTAPELQSRTVLLNGKELVLDAQDELPVIAAERLEGDRIALAPLSINFIALPQAGNRACRN
jgi:heparanase 1